MKPIHKGAFLSAVALAIFAALFHFLPDGAYQLPLIVGAIAAFCFAFNYFLRRS